MSKQIEGKLPLDIDVGNVKMLYCMCIFFRTIY